MTRPADVFRCDYCGELTSIEKAVIYWVPVDELRDDQVLFLPAVYCGPYCGSAATTRSGTGRG